MGMPTRPGERLVRLPPIREILACIRGELIDLVRQADDLQITIGAIVAGSSSTLSPSIQVRLQTADALSQRLDHLAQLARALEAEIPQGLALAPDSKSASDLVQALRRVCDPGRPSADLRPEDEGECEMF